MEVPGMNPVQGSLPVQPTQPAGETSSADSAGPVAPRDDVEISEAGRLMQELSEPSDLRAERLAQIKEAINDGTYETEEKLQVAIERLLNDLDSPEA